MRYAPRHHGWGVVRVGTFRIRNDQEANLMKAPGDMDCSDGRARSTVIIDEARRLGHGRNFISYPRRMLLTADANGTKAELGRQSGDHPQRRRSTGSIGVTSHAPRAPSNSGRSLSPCFRHATSGGRALHSRSPTPVSPSSLNRPSRRSLSEGAHTSIPTTFGRGAGQRTNQLAGFRGLTSAESRAEQRGTRDCGDGDRGRRDRGGHRWDGGSHRRDGD